MKEKVCKIDESQNTKASLFHCAHLILPWLDPTELASISSTCKTLNSIAKSITTARISDASRTFENLPVPLVNTVDDQPYAYFNYTPTQTLASNSSFSGRQPWGGFRVTRPGLFVDTVVVRDACGCGCERCDVELECPCREMSAPELSRECGPSCKCELECGNRLTQKGINVKVKIVKDERKGWGLFSSQVIREGDFVCEYAGELLTTKEARLRQQKYDKLAQGGKFFPALLVVREHLPSGNACMRINIDANRVGNFARFLNHSCDGGNLSTVLVRSSGALLPRLCFFASKDILEGELLTTKEARLRQQKYDKLAQGGKFFPALLVVREHLPSGNACMRINIDATRVGNFARFLNHSCNGGNLSTVLVRSSGALLPRLCFFASKDILEGEELSFSYGDIRLKKKGLQCFCGSSCCFGILPSEQT